MTGMRLPRIRGARLRDAIAAIVILSVGLLAVFVAIPNGVQVPETLTNPALSPAFWPRIIGYGAILGAVFLLIETFSMRAPPPDLTAEEEAEADLAHSRTVGAGKVAILIAALFVFYASLTTIGVVAASVVLMGAMMLFFGERKYVLVAVLSLSIPLLLYGFFRYVASVPIPLGIFGN